MMKFASVIFSVALLLTKGLSGQSAKDTLLQHQVSPVEIEVNSTSPDLRRLDPIQGTYIHSGKKNDVILLTQKNGVLTEKYGRQIFSKIPGVFVYDMDGTGNQLNISVRGLDPHRGWEFNIRKDGIITNSDMYGYPASHYNIPMEAVERIEMVRGTGSLQYGAQFGGMLNYISKQPDSTRVFSFENINTVGSYGLVSTYNGASGKLGNFRYSAWMNKKWNTGYRENSQSEFNAEGVSLFYDPSKNLRFKLEWTHSKYITQLAGPLTDAMFNQNPRMATRSRNYYSPDIHIPSMNIVWNVTPKTQAQFTSSAVLGFRNSVMFDRAATIADTIVTATMQYNNRQVDIDQFNSYTSELRILKSYTIAKWISAFVFGVQNMNNNLWRRQQGKGTTGSDYDLSLLSSAWGRDLHFRTSNFAFFAENRWVLSSKFSLNTGIRYEAGKSKLSGTTSYYSNEDLTNIVEHKFPLFGVSTQYDINEKTELYGGWSQAYRPVILKDIVPQTIFEVADKNIKDAYGQNAEIGIRGKWKIFRWDVTGFYILIKNRLGNLAQTDSLGNLIIYRTNTGNSRTTGLEFFLQSEILTGPKSNLTLFTSTSYMNARYFNSTVRSGNENIVINGNICESVPRWNTRNGATWKAGAFAITALYSFISESYSDALNTTEPSSTGATGIVPAYQILDFNITYKFNSQIKLQVNVNNVLDESYFTKRPQFYPGPGIWSSDGRTLSMTLCIRV